MMFLPYKQADKNGVIFHLKVIQNSSKNEICGTIDYANGQQLLKVKVVTAPDDGKANNALIKFLAKEWGASASNIEII